MRIDLWNRQPRKQRGRASAVELQPRVRGFVSQGPRPTRLFRRFTVFLLIFVGLFLLWPLVESAYGSAFRHASNALVGVGSHGRNWFAQATTADPHFDTRLTVVDRKTRTERSTTFSSRRYGYLPTVLVVALALSTPLGRRDRTRGLFWCLVAVHMYIAVRIAFMPAAYAVDVGQIAQGSAWWQLGLARLYRGMDSSTAGWMFVPIALWGLVMLKPIYALRKATAAGTPAVATRRVKARRAITCTS